MTRRIFTVVLLQLKSFPDKRNERFNEFLEQYKESDQLIVTVYDYLKKHEQEPHAQPLDYSIASKLERLAELYASMAVRIKRVRSELVEPK